MGRVGNSDDISKSAQVEMNLANNKNYYLHNFVLPVDFGTKRNCTLMMK